MTEHQKLHLILHLAQCESCRLAANRRVQRRHGLRWGWVRLLTWFGDQLRWRRQ